MFIIKVNGHDSSLPFGQAKAEAAAALAEAKQRAQDDMKDMKERLSTLGE